MNAPVPAAVRGSTIELPRVLTVAQARDFGLSRGAVEHAIRRLGWQRLTRGIVLTAPGEPRRADWAEVGFALGGPGAALSGWDAARVVGLGSVQPPAEHVLVLTRTGEHRVVGGVRIRPTRRRYDVRLLSAEHPELAFAPVVSVARAVADTALLHRSLTATRALITSSVQRRFCTAQQLAAELAGCPRNGSAYLRRAIADVFHNAHSVAEAEAIEALHKRKVAPFEANVDIFDRAGRLIATVDLCWQKIRAIVEIDSREFHFSDADWQKTLRRHTRLTILGYALIHYSPSEMRRQGTRWATEVAEWLEARAREVGVTL